MKIYKNIFVVLFITIFTISNISATGTSSSVSSEMQTAIKEAKYTQQKVKLLNELNNLFLPKLQNLTEKYKTSLSNIEEGIKNYEKVIVKIDLLVSKLDSNSLKQMSIHKPIFLRIKEMVVSEKSTLLNEKEKLTTAEEEKTEDKIVNEIKEDIENGVTYSGTDRNDVMDEMRETGISPLESTLITWLNFQYCVNFTPDVYKDHGFGYYYSSGQQENTWAIDSLWVDFVDIKIPKIYEDSELGLSFMDIQKCVRYQQGLSDYYETPVTQEYVKELYKKYYGKDLKVWTKPFYDNTTEKMYEILGDPQKYIGDYQGNSNYNVKFDRSRGGE